MPNSMGDASEAECGGDEEVTEEVNNDGGVRSRDQGGDDCESNSDADSTAGLGLNGGENGKLPARIETVGVRYQTDYNHKGSSSEVIFAKKRCEDRDFANLGPDMKDTELRLGLPEVRHGKKVANPDSAFFDGILHGGRIKGNLNGVRCGLDSQPRGYSIQGEEHASVEEFKLKPMFREFATMDLPFDVRFSHARPSSENNNGGRGLLSSGVKRIFSESFESSRASGSGEPKPQPLYLPPPIPASSFNFPVASGEPKPLYLPPPIPASSFNFPFAGGPRAPWRMQTRYGQFCGHLGPNEVKINEAALSVKSPLPDQKAAPAESQPSGSQNGTTSSEQRSARVVGWPPVRSFRRNLASQPKAAPAAHPNAAPAPPAGPPVPAEQKPATMFVKVNVDGVPIGRKIDLKAYDSYDKLAVALDEMFRFSIPVQNPSSSSANPPFSLSSGDYVLVYEDDEGDRMLVGDVPWRMFVATVKRLRIIRSSEARGLGDRRSSLKAKVGTS